MSKLVSVILPVYNGERYLQRAIDSVLDQTIGIENIFIIVINDGSTDQSLTILNKNAQKFPDSFQIINQENSGVAESRNKGIKATQTPYLTFLDQDDFFDQDFLKVLYTIAKKTEADIVNSGYKRPDENMAIKQVVKTNRTEYGRFMLNVAWSKLHRTAFVKENNIQFFSNPIGEDVIPILDEALGASENGWVNIDYTGYNWFYNKESVSNTSQRRLLAENFEAVNAFIDELRKRYLKKPDNENLKYFFYKTICYSMLFCGKKATKRQFIAANSKLLTLFSDQNGQTPKSAFLPFGPKGETLTTRAVVGLYQIMNKLKLLGLFASIYCEGEE
jgi:glycosyltransferase involved in cell wall biosynthesis